MGGLLGVCGEVAQLLAEEEEDIATGIVPVLLQKTAKFLALETLLNNTQLRATTSNATKHQSMEVVTLSQIGALVTLMIRLGLWGELLY